MSPFNIYRSSEATRRAGNAPEPSIGSTSDERAFYVGSTETRLGYPSTLPQVPLAGQDVRRVWQVASQGQSNTWTDVGAVARDASGIVLSAMSTPQTASVGLGYVDGYELADGGEIVITATGTYKPGSILPRFLARLKIGANYVTPQYEATNPNTPAVADVVSTQANAFEWSSQTMGLNALGGYEALWLHAANLTKGEFQWRLTMRVHALGRYAKWQRGDDDHAAADDATAWVEAKLEWGALQANSGARIGESFGLYNPMSAQTMQYNACMPNGVVRGSVYTFGGQQWLCHASSTSTAVAGAGPARTLTHNNWTQMLAEEAPGVGMHWREFFVPLVSRATISAFPVVDWSIGNEIALELGGPVQEDLGTTWGVYGATTTYLAEVGATPFTGGARGVVDTGVVYSPKTTMYVASFPRMTAASEVSLFTGAVTDRRCWRPLPTTLRDEMRVQTSSAYLFGGRVGAYQSRGI